MRYTFFEMRFSAEFCTNLTDSCESPFQGDFGMRNELHLSYA
jgi:hypothetical protein